jgi:predicted urease superfamily metal-dependent hydrolase
VGVLSHIIRDMGEESPGCVVLIEDLDYLVANAGLFPTLGMLEDVLRLAARASMTVMMSSDLLTDAERRELRDLGVLLLPRDGDARAPA